jgi:hypothetical protein
MPKSILITFKGRKQSISAWARECGMNHQALRWRLQNGWSIEKALTTPVDPRSPHIVTHNANAIALCRQLRALSEALCLASYPRPLDSVRNDLRKRAQAIGRDINPPVVEMFENPLDTGGGSVALDCTKTDFSENRGSDPCR